MIDGWIAWSIRHRVAVLVATLILAAWGGYAASVAPIDAIPDLSENQVIVHAEWPGRGPAEVEDGVTAPLAAALNGIAGVRTIRSSSDFGAATFWVILDDGADVAEVRRALGERLASGDGRDRLPPGVVPRLGPDGPATGQIFWYTVEGGGLDLGRLRAFQDGYVKPRLAAVPGVAEVASVGGMVAEIHVDADPARLRRHRVALPDLVAAVSGAAGSGGGGGGVVHRSNAEFVVRTAHPPGDRSGRFDPDAALEDLGRAVVPTLDGRTVLVADVAAVGFGPQPRRGALEKDGVEVAGGVVLMARGANPLDLTRRLKAEIRGLAAGLPPGVKVVPMYDRTPLILGAVETVAGTIVEAMVSASICVLLILRHPRAVAVIVATPPLSVLAAFGALELFRRLGIADVPINAMSLAGLAISVGVLVDSAIVMTENVLHSASGEGDPGPAVERACRQVGRPIVYAILIMLLSFLPVFALGGLEGRMFRPLAATKTLALAASGVLAVTLVPALCSMLLRGRSRPEPEGEGWIVRGVAEVYRPVLDSLLDRPAPLVWVLAATGLLASAAIGHRGVFLGTLGAGLLAVGLTGRRAWGRAAGITTLGLVALVADTSIDPLGREFLAPLDEGMVMDMPISIPRMSIAQGVDDLKARDMVLCRFPEVAMVVGKLGRAETPTDPAPLDMIETMVEFHPREFWPARAIDAADAARQVAAVVAAMARAGLIDAPAAAVEAEIAEASIAAFDAAMREYAYQRNRELFRSHGFEESAWRLDGLPPDSTRRWRDHARAVDAELMARGPGLFTRVAIEEALGRAPVRVPALSAYLAELLRIRSGSAPVHHAPADAGAPHHAMSRTAAMPEGLAPQPALDALLEERALPFARGLVLRRKTRGELTGAGGDLDRAVPMPGWTNVWTMPIQNRVDMLATGVNTTVGIRVLGRDPEQAAAVAARVAEVVKAVPGAADVVADPYRGKGAVEVQVDRDRAARLGVAVGEVDAVVETAMGGTVAASARSGHERTPIRVGYDRSARGDEDAVRNLLVRSLPPGKPGPARLIPLAEVADVRVVDSPSTIKGENGQPRSYVRLNVRGRDLAAFVDEARRLVGERTNLPEGSSIEWTGRFEHEIRARRTLGFVVPGVLVLIFGLLWATYRDLADAAAIMLAIPGALAGGVVCQWLLGAAFSVTIWVGYIACFGMATSTGVIMLVYLRDAVERAGGLAGLDAAGLRRAVLDGATQRLRPKLLTEATILLGLAPMLWAGGVGGEILGPMAAPVLGGIIVADEVIDLFLPIVFYRVRLRRLGR